MSGRTVPSRTDLGRRRRRFSRGSLLAADSKGVWGSLAADLKIQLDKVISSSQQEDGKKRAAASREPAFPIRKNLSSPPSLRDNRPVLSANPAGRDAPVGRFRHCRAPSNSHPLCCTDQQLGEVSPRIHVHVRRTYSGRPSSSMRFREATAMATSVVGRPSVRERSASPITRL
jgi:hypothetical protein